MQMVNLALVSWCCRGRHCSRNVKTVATQSESFLLADLTGFLQWQKTKKPPFWRFFVARATWLRLGFGGVQSKLQKEDHEV